MDIAQLTDRQRRLDRIVDEFELIVREMKYQMGRAKIRIDDLGNLESRIPEDMRDRQREEPKPKSAIASEAIKSAVQLVGEHGSASVSEIVDLLGVPYDKSIANQVGAALYVARWERYRRRDANGKREYRYRPPLVLHRPPLVLHPPPAALGAVPPPAA